MADQCSHKFTDTDYCVKCGATLEAIKAAGYDEAMRLLAQLGAELGAARPVLDAWSRAPETELQWVMANIVSLSWLRDAARAEFTRRALLLSGDQTSHATDNPAENKPVPR